MLIAEFKKLCDWPDNIMINNLKKYHSLISISLILILVRFTLMLFNILIIRYISVEDYGKVAYADSIGALVLVLGGLGMHTIGIRNVTQKKSSISSIFTNVVTARVFFTFVINIFSYMFFINKNYSNEFLIYNFMYIFLQIFLIDWFLIAIDNKKTLMISMLSGVVFQFIVFLYFIMSTQLTIENIRLTQLIYITVSVFIMIYNTKHYFSYDTLKVRVVLKYMKKSFPLLGSYGFQQTYYAGIPILISNYLGFYEAGVYSASSRLALVLISLRNLVLQPLSRNIYKLDASGYIKKHKQYLLVVLPACFIYYFLTFYFSKEILELFFSSEYSKIEVVNTFRVIMLLPIVYFIFFGHTTILISVGKHKYYFYATMSGAALFLCVIFVNYFRGVSTFEFACSFLLIETYIFLILHFVILKKINGKNSDNKL